MREYHTVRVTVLTVASVVAISLLSVLVVGVAGVSGASGTRQASARPAAPAKQAVHQHVGAGHSSTDMAGMDMSTAKPADDKGLSLLENGHHHKIGTEQAMSRDERALLTHQIDGTIATAKRYPTVASALADGYIQTGPYLPGIGAHFIKISGGTFNPDGVMDDADIASPLAIVYDGTDPDARIAGFMYYAMSKNEPAGFAGGNDVWHYHQDLCLKFGGAKGIEVPYGLDNSATAKQCESVGGKLMTQTNWMVHVWSVPGWESRQGLFGEVNPALMCPDGTYYQYPPEQWSAHPQNACKSAP